MKNWKTDSKIFKYKLDPYTEIDMPEGAEILSVGVQKEQVFLWMRVEPLPGIDPSKGGDLCDARVTRRTFRAFCTGESIPSGNMQFIGTVMLSGGDLVFHIFEVLE